jgi:hypothetical protein
MPKYFESEWSYAQYRLPTQTEHISLSQTSIRTPGRDPDVPDEERCVVGWIAAPPTPGAPPEHQLVALTWTGGWYRLTLPVSSTLPTPAGAPTRTPLSASPPTRTPLLPPVPSRAASTVQSGRADKGKGKEREKDKSRSACTLQEFRRFGRFDGWL